MQYCIISILIAPLKVLYDYKSVFDWHLAFLKPQVQVASFVYLNNYETERINKDGEGKTEN